MATLVECVECGDTHPMGDREWRRGVGQLACPVCGALDFRPANP
jgi:predicted  nucleic acid-binding Zn-ribbon protein